MTKKKILLIASKGSLDMAYPPLLIATAAAAMDLEVTIFFTFFGVDILKIDNADKLKISPVGNPALPMPIPIPTLIAALPGMEAMATAMMKSMFKKHGVASIGTLLNLAIDAGVKLYGCQMTMDAMDIKRSDLIGGVEFGGAALLVDLMTSADIQLFI
jgi:peroxiredoxin family protein